MSVWYKKLQGGVMVPVVECDCGCGSYIQGKKGDTDLDVRDQADACGWSETGPMGSYNWTPGDRCQKAMR